MQSSQQSMISPAWRQACRTRLQKVGCSLGAVVCVPRPMAHVLSVSHLSALSLCLSISCLSTPHPTPPVASFVSRARSLASGGDSSPVLPCLLLLALQGTCYIANYGLSCTHNYGPGLGQPLVEQTSVGTVARLGPPSRATLGALGALHLCPPRACPFSWICTCIVLCVLFVPSEVLQASFNCVNTTKYLRLTEGDKKNK